MPTKSLFRSKTVGVNLAVVVLVYGLSKFWGGFREAMCGNAEFILSALALLNMALRRITKVPTKLITGILLFLVVGCSSVSQSLDPALFYKRDVGIEVNGKAYEGVTVLPHAETYDITLVPKGSIDLMLIRSCHREYTVEKKASGWFIFKNQPKYTYKYTPVKGIEDERVCPLRIEVFDSARGQHSWAFLDAENPKYQLWYQLTCNGETVTAHGVGICQAKERTFQRLTFSEPVRFAPQEDKRCSAPTKINGSYEIQAQKGECLYHFDTQDGKLGRLTMVGFQGVLIRQEQ